MPDEFGFNHIPRWGFVSVQCTECDLSAPIYALQPDERERHSKTHLQAVRIEHIDADGNVTSDRSYTVTADGMRVQTCRNCGEEFEKPTRRGRPQLECDTCKGKDE